MSIDCDANATYLPEAELQGVIAACLKHLGNPSSLHRGGQRARAALEEARALVRETLGASSGDSVVFTSGATEANNMVVNACARLGARKLVASAIEHPCVLEPLSMAGAHSGADVVLVAPGTGGIVSCAGMAAALTEDTTLVSVMAANNETGVVNPVAEIARTARSRSPQVLTHTDAAQVPGKGELSFRDLGVDFMTVSGHKFGAPSGIGALLIRHGIGISPLILGGPQEAKLRAGTENVFGAAAMAGVLSRVGSGLASRIGAMRGARDHFERLVRQCVPGVIFNGEEHPRLPNTSSVCIPGVRGDDLVVALDLEGVLASSGAACSSGKPGPSHVLRAMGQPLERVKSTIRISFRADVRLGDVERVVAALARVLGRMNRGS